jgi:nicotinate-nucleotide adenylyltransferase
MIGILGGTFDPVHLGHLHIASQVSTQLQLRQLHFMPCALPVHRGLPHASAEHRCAMIRLALREIDCFVLNTLELEREGPSYSVDSLREMHRQSDDSLLLVLGADAFNGFGSWKEPHEILRLANLVVCGRPGFEIDAELFGEHQVKTVSELSRASAGAILPLEVNAIDCSSSAVRASLLQSQVPRQLLPIEVANYINEHNLYRKPGD